MFNIVPGRRGWLRSRVSTSLIVSLGVLAGILLLTPAASAATCFGASCNLRTPQETACAADGQVIASETIQRRDYDFFSGQDIPYGPVYGTASLWESVACNAVWITANQPADSGLELWVGIAARTGDNSGTAQSTVGTDVTSKMWSPVPGDPYIGGFGYVAETLDGAFMGYPTPAGDPYVWRP